MINYTGKKICAFAVTLSMLGMGGCAQLQGYGGSLWQQSRSLGNAFTSLLRPAPKQNEQFFASAEIGADTNSSIIADTPIIQTASIPAPQLRPVLTTDDVATLESFELEVLSLGNNEELVEEKLLDMGYSAASHTIPAPTIPVLMAELPDIKLKAKPEMTAKVKPKPKVKPRPITITLPKMDDIEMLAGAPSSARKLAFVNKKGRTDIKDLNICAKQAGNTYIESFMGYDIHPEFLICLNDKGYVSVKNTKA